MKKRMKNILAAINANRQMQIGLILLLVLILVAILAPVLAPHDPYVLNDDILMAPCAKYPLGTDGLGHDVLSELIYGTRTSLTIGLVAASISAVIGTTLGGVAGYFGGVTDKILNELMNVFLMIPSFFLILLIIAIYGSSMLNVMIVIGLTSWVGNARLMRAQAIALRKRTFVLSATAMGESRSSILWKHVIPNGIFPIIANTTMNISGAILSEAGLSFLGLGDPNIVSWGQVINAGKAYLPTYWWITTFAGVAIVFTVLTFYLIGDGLTKILSPKMAAGDK